MSQKPITHYPWATEDLTQDITVNGVDYTIPNKTEPEAEFKSRGILYGEGMPIQYWNYQLNGYYKWFKHLDERYSIGDIFEATYYSGVPTQEAISSRLGGTWTYLGFKTTFSFTTYVFKKVS